MVKIVNCEFCNTPPINSKKVYYECNCGITYYTGDAPSEREKRQEERIAKLEEALGKLLNKVNRVTSLWRHHNKTNAEDLTALCNRQLEVEKALED